MIVVDSSALMAVLPKEPEGQEFVEIMSGQDRCLISAVSVLEASIVLAGRNGDANDWHGLDALIARTKSEVRPHDAALTRLAREAFVRFGKGRHPAALNFGDCAAYALAKSEGASLLFKGNDFSRTDIQSAV